MDTCNQGNAMKLEHVINWSIINYPTLYRDVTLERSRLKVLNQLFFVIGNGFEWHKDGFLFDGNKRNFRKILPKGFFEKNLYTVAITPKSIPLVKKRIADRFYYIKKNSRFREVDVIFEAKDDDDALPFYREFEKKLKKDLPTFIYKARSEDPNQPYPLSQYSALVEIVNGKTNSLHQNNFDLVPQEDWLKGCAEVAKDALDYFNDENRNLIDFHHADRTIAEMTRDFKRGDADKWLKNMKPSETANQYAWRQWNEYRNEQIGLLEAFFAKFGALA